MKEDWEEKDGLNRDWGRLRDLAEKEMREGFVSLGTSLRLGSQAVILIFSLLLWILLLDKDAWEVSQEDR